MSKRRRRKFTNEFKAETVKLILESGKTVAASCTGKRNAAET